MTTSAMAPLPCLRALNYLEGKIISRTEAKHTHVEWLRFLKQIDRETPKDLEIHMIADNYGHSQTRQRPRVDAASPAFSPCILRPRRVPG